MKYQIWRYNWKAVAEKWFLSLSCEGKRDGEQQCVGYVVVVLLLLYEKHASADVVAPKG